MIFQPSQGQTRKDAPSGLWTSVRSRRRKDGGIVRYSYSRVISVESEVRRMASAIHAVNSSNSSIDEIVDALRNPGHARDLGRAPADALLLWNINHSDIPTSWSAPVPELPFHSPPLNATPEV